MLFLMHVNVDEIFLVRVLGQRAVVLNDLGHARIRAGVGESAEQGVQGGPLLTCVRRLVRLNL